MAILIRLRYIVVCYLIIIIKYEWALGNKLGARFLSNRKRGACMKKNDIFLIGALLLIGVGLFLGYRIFYRQVGASVEITVDGKVYQNLSLAKDQKLEIPTEDGGRNVLSIQDGYADMTEANCPDGLCVKQAKISHNGETIVCLPHKVVIKVMNDTRESDTGVDGNAY